MAGYTGSAGVVSRPLISSIVAATSFSNTDAEETLGSVTIPSASMVAGTVIRVRCSGFFARDGAIATVQFTPKLDGNQLENLSVGAGNTAGEWLWDFTITIRTAGAGGTYSIEGDGAIDIAVASPILAGNGEDSVDTTSDVDITITGQMGAANGANNMSIQTFQVWLYPPS